MTSPYIALHGLAPSYEHLRMFNCISYPNLFAKFAHKLAPRSTRCVFFRYSTEYKGYQCLDLIINNIVVSRHVFYEADFSFSFSPCLTNNLDIFLHYDSPVSALMPVPLPAYHVPPGFPSLAATGDQTTPEIEAGSPIARPGG
jgi:hypothetical protein